MQFYKCTHCGNVAVKLFDQGVTLVCCGEQMIELKAGSSGGAPEKHMPVVEGSEILHVQVGSEIHPMVEEHFITMIVLETTQGFQVKHLHPGDSPEADFVVNPGDKAVAVYEYCNLHGLWKTEL